MWKDNEVKQTVSHLAGGLPVHSHILGYGLDALDGACSDTRRG